MQYIEVPEDQIEDTKNKKADYDSIDEEDFEK